MNLAINKGSRATDVIVEGSGIILTYFEIGNSIWKLCHLLKKLTDDEAKSLLGVSLKLFNRLEILDLAENDAIEIAELANAHGVTFYDSSYLYAAKKNRLTLVTDDERLAKASRHEKLKVLPSASVL